MVLFHNINVGQKVEVNIGWGSIRGTVQYKGCLAGKQGEWVGVYLEEKGKYCQNCRNCHYCIMLERFTIKKVHTTTKVHVI